MTAARIALPWLTAEARRRLAEMETRFDKVSDRVVGAQLVDGRSVRGWHHRGMVGERIELVPTSLDSVPALVRLFDDPSFDGWGGPAPLAPEEIAAKYAGARLPEVECFLVEVDASPAGLAVLHADGVGVGGMDLILLPSTRGRGAGRSVVSLLVERARDVHGWQRLTVDPDLANTAGVRFWTSAGFTPVREEPATPERQPFVLMEMVLTGP